MKKLSLVIVLLIVTAALTACGSKGDTAAQNDPPASQAAANGAQAATAVAEAPLMTNDEVAAQIGAPVLSGQAAESADAAPVEASEAPSGGDRPVDLDLTKISGTVVYSQVYDMTMNPDRYMGQRIRIRGSFSYFRDPDTEQEYFAAVIADATACCAQGIEFVWKGEHTYPRDYPPLDTEITVTGTFSTYYEGELMYIQLKDAQVSWSGGQG